MVREEATNHAIKAAQNACFESAAYIGTQDGKHIFVGVAKAGEPTGLPMFIEVSASGAVNTEYSFKYMHLIKEQT